MATRGVKQLRKLKLIYCEHGGSSASVREFISSGRVVSFAKENPDVTLIVKPRNGKHPHVMGQYLTGYDKQICVKNESLKRIEEVLQMLNNTSGRKITKLSGKSVRTATPSIQGIWTPMLDIADQQFQVELHE